MYSPGDVVIVLTDSTHKEVGRVLVHFADGYWLSIGDGATDIIFRHADDLGHPPKVVRR